MSEPKRVLRPMADAGSTSAPKSLSEAPDRSATVIAFGMVAVVSMLFGFVIGLLF
jgi:hypothetical protein